MQRLRQIGLAVVLVIVMRAGDAGAQTSAAPQPVTTGFDNGFFIQSPDGATRLTLGFVAQTDGRFSVDDPLPIVNTFTIRKIRPTFTGRLTKFFEFKVMPDFGNGTTVIQDAYFDTRFSQAFRVRVGKDKTPVGYELLIGDASLYFPERALASSLVPNRDIGVQAHGDLAGGKLTYAGGLFNGIPDGTSSTTELDTNSDTAPSSTDGIEFPVHVLAIAAMGVHLLDYLRLEELLAACERAGRWEFLFVAAPLRIAGGTGSPSNPIAIL